VRRSKPSRLGRATLAIATILLIVAVALASLFNPMWIGAAQARADVSAITGWSETEVQRITGAILADVIVGPPAFDVMSAGTPVLDPAERVHMADVFTVLRGFALVVLVTGSAGGLLLRRHRSEPAAWTAVSRGAGGLAITGVILALVVTLFFDAAFLAFHLIVFPQGNFSFDSATERLTQLFPGQFWTESATAIVVVGTGIASVVWWFARLRARRLVVEASTS
jgi:hypothetical protein